VFVYNVADHKTAFHEVGSQGISYTAGVPAAAAALLIASGEWDVRKMVNVEELPPEPFVTQLDRLGLPTRVVHEGTDSSLLGEDEPAVACRTAAYG
jgi:saccharopine dehydrogenase-like NADP-dependent oxidoreductase